MYIDIFFGYFEQFSPATDWTHDENIQHACSILAATKKVAGEEHHISVDAIRSLRNANRGTKIALVTLTIPTAKKVLGELHQSSRKTI